MSSSNDWYLECLGKLGHFDPKIVDEALGKNDDELKNICLWVEDRIIRLWDLAEREELRNNFWSSIGRYLDELECPSAYRKDAWQRDSERRRKVLYWILSCAISEAFGDVQPKTDQAKIDPKTFPLGFTTENSEVDRILTLIRMEHVIRLRKEQDRINQAIEELQKMTVENTKPLKMGKR